MLNRAAAGLSLLVVTLLLNFNDARADGKVMPPRNYTGSLEEKGQEAIIIFQSGSESQSATEDLILKIQVVGEAEQFAWIVPFPTAPKISEADPALFSELFRYVESRNRYYGPKSKDKGRKTPQSAAKNDAKVQVISREMVGDYEVAVVRENAEGGLNPWLDENGFQTLKNADDVLDFYRRKNYVYACVKFNSKALATKKSIESRPLRFEFKTGGRDGIYFPMKMTSLQERAFDVNLYVFHRYWINDDVSPYGFKHRGFRLSYRDWDSAKCVADGGKSYSLPSKDPFLRSYANQLKSVAKLFQTLHPGRTFYLTNIKARHMEPSAVRQWKDDLWLFPYYTDSSVVPYDALKGGAAAAAYPAVAIESGRSPSDRHDGLRRATVAIVAGSVVGLALLAMVFARWRRQPRLPVGKKDI